LIVVEAFAVKKRESEEPENNERNDEKSPGW